jgi:nudix-type nucleoside diphosphatase (YffH/AdpP family)
MPRNGQYIVKRETVLAENWGRLSRYDLELKTRSGDWQTMSREVYDHGDGVACLLFDPDEETVLLTRQFRLPAAVAGNDGFLIEAPAGLLDGDRPEARMMKELEEETGYRVSSLTYLFSIFMSPGSLTEKIALFRGVYHRQQHAVGPGGGIAEEGEDIEVLHMRFDDAMAMIGTGEISDAKTIILLQHLALEMARNLSDQAR